MWSTAIVLFFVIDPVGLIPLYASILAKVPAARRRRVLVRELVFALMALVVFLFLGKYILELLHISDAALTIAGAFILLLLAIPMVFPSVKLSMESEDLGEPFIVPMAIPLFAGPSALAMVILLGTGEHAGNWMTWLGSVALAWAGSAAILLVGEAIASKLGKRGLAALERLVGMLLVAIATQMFLSGLTTYLEAA